MCTERRTILWPTNCKSVYDTISIYYVCAYKDERS